MPIRHLPLRLRRTLPCLVLLALAAAPSAQAQRSTAPPVDPDAVLATLKDLKTKQTPIINKARRDVLGAIAAAQADPARAYEQAVVSVEFQGQGNDGARLVEWRKKQGDLLRNRDFINGLRLQLAYISLTWQRTMGIKNKELLAALYDYTNQVFASYDTLWGFEQLRRPLGQNLFVSYFQIGPYISGVSDWSDQPLDVDSIYQKSILPVLRDTKDPRLLDYWAAKIQSELTKADRSGNSIAVSKFNNVRRPSLLWDRAEDEYLIGDHDRAIAEMLALIKAHPDHPDFDKWTARLTELVTPKGEVIVHDGPDQPPAPAPKPPSPVPAPKPTPAVPVPVPVPAGVH